MERETAVVLANDAFTTPSAKTAHGLVRGPSRYDVLAVVDASVAGSDAGELLDGRHRAVPVVASMQDVLRLWEPGRDASHSRPHRCVVGIAPSGGHLPATLRRDLITAAEAGVGLVSGLHTSLAHDAEIAAAAKRGGAEILDVRRPAKPERLAHWSGEIVRVRTPRIAVLGTDCCIGKRTTATWLVQGLCDAGVRTELVSTGQTGWLQGASYGFFLDATPNDFVSGELERVVLACSREAEPDLIVLEGQSSFFNPSGPCGAEFILSAGARAVILQEAPGRVFHDDLEDAEVQIAPAEKHVAMAELLGARVIACTMNGEGLSEAEALAACESLQRTLGLPVIRPREQGVGTLVEIVRQYVVSDTGR